MKTIALILSLLCAAATLQQAPALASPESRIWHAWGESGTPPSRPTGQPFLVTFTNRQHEIVKIFWLSPAGERKYYYTIPPEGTKPQNVRKDAVWIVTNVNDEPLGYFVFGAPTARAVIPQP